MHEILSIKVDKFPIPPLEQVQKLVEQLSIELDPNGIHESTENGYQRVLGDPRLYLQSRSERIIDGLRRVFNLHEFYHQRSGITKMIDSLRLSAKPRTSIEYDMSGIYRMYATELELYLDIVYILG